MNSVVILDAGRGTKMWPFTETQPRACLPISGEPLIAHTLSMVQELGFKSIRVVVGHLEEQVRWALRSFSNMKYNTQSNLNGTADALKEVYEHNELEECVVIYGDTLISVSDLEILVNAHGNIQAFAMTLVKPLRDERPVDWLCAKVEDSMALKILGHPRSGVTHQLTGIVALSKEALNYVILGPGIMNSVQVGQMPPLQSELTQCLQNVISTGQRIHAISVQDGLTDIDKPWHLLEANQEYLKYAFSRMKTDDITSSSHISSKADIRGKLILGENVYIGSGVRINGDLMVGDNTVIDNGIIIGNAAA